MSVLDGSVHVFGKEIPRKTVAGAAVVLGVGGAIYYRHNQAAAATADTSGTASTTAQSIDPQTGDIAGSSQDAIDLAALQQEQTANQVDAASAITGSGQVIGYDVNGNPIYGSGGGSLNPPSTGNAFTTNSQWGQAAESALGSSGTDAIGTAIGKYLQGQPLTSDQVTVIQQAMALVGSPPVPGANGDPPGIQTTGTAANPPTTTNKGQKGVPNVVGQRATPAIATLKAAGFKASTVPVRNPQSEYTVTAQAPEGGKVATVGTSVTLTVKEIKK
jgi:hypothetical protein